jgi:predicted cobalt transporter CbtA
MLLPPSEMKQKFATIAVMSALLAGLSTTAHAAYSEQWMSPQDLKKEEAAHSKRHKPADACAPAASHCTREHSKVVTGKARSAAPVLKAVRTDDPIAAFAAKGNVKVRNPSRSIPK